MQGAEKWPGGELSGDLERAAREGKHLGELVSPLRLQTALLVSDLCEFQGLLRPSLFGQPPFLLKVVESSSAQLRFYINLFQHALGLPEISSVLDCQ